MFFHRIWKTRPTLDTNTNTSIPIHDCSNDNGNVILEVNGSTPCMVDKKDNNNNSRNQSSSSPPSFVNKMQRRSEQSVGVVQLTPLWEHVLRTRRLPETICPSSMFAEFHERLQDPEWQVRQHALRVLVDVLVVMQAKADKFNISFLIDLIRNLGHQAPTVRKGALDCLRVYLSETAIPKIVMLQILETGLSQQSTCDERLSCGVLLSLPALLQSILHTSQYHFVIKDILDCLMQRLHQQQMQQEITLRVLAKISELLGVQEFESYLNDLPGNECLSLYRHLYKLYGISNKPSRSEGTNAGAWRAIPREHTWRTTPEAAPLSEKGKVIMETEIKINDDTLTMRILEAETETEETDSPITERDGDLVCRSLVPQLPQLETDAGGIIQIISDSEAEDLPDALAQNETLLGTPSRGLKRVTFGGEVVKMRTPDSDAASSTNNMESTSSRPDQSKVKALALNETSSLPLPPDDHTEESFLTALTLDIPSDNTKPLPQTRSTQSPKKGNSFSNQTALPTVKSSGIHASPRGDIFQSPAYRSRSRSISPAGSTSVSPKIPHKEIEVLHNLQRDVDPLARSFRHSDSATAEQVTPSPIAVTEVSMAPAKLRNCWEDLGIVSYKTILDLRSGDWRNRLQGIAQLEIALSSSSNLLLVQPYLNSLLRTLLSSERNCNVADLKRELLVNLISRLPLDNLEDRTQQILSGLCRQENAGANRVCKALMQRLPAGTIVATLTAPEFLHAKSSKFRDHALQMAIYALMTFPGTCFDINILTAQVTYAALNRKRRVRQAALEVLAVLADISSVDQILDIVADIAAGIEIGPDLLSAVKIRLSRLQLPIISPDGAVLYIFHKAEQTGPLGFGADVDWVAQGEGSASPNAAKRRNMHLIHKKKILHDKLNAENTNMIGVNHNYHPDENLHLHSFHSPPEALDISRSSTVISQGNFLERRPAAQIYSESSIDGRSSDSTTTTCSSGSGSGSFIQLTHCNTSNNKRIVRQNSRFPIMTQHTDFVTKFMQNMHRTPYPYSFEDSKYPKITYPPHKPSRHQEAKKQSTSQQQCWRSNMGQVQCKGKLEQAELIAAAATSTTVQSAESEIANPTAQGSPLSVKSTSYSQKSTASAKSYSSQREMGKLPVSRSVPRTDIETLSLEQQIGELVVDDIEEETELPPQESTLKRNESVNSLHSKTESIKTQLEDATPQMSRAQSIKSLAIEEEIESSNSFVVVEELQQELESAAGQESPEKLVSTAELPLAAVSRASPCRKPIGSHDDSSHSRSLSLDSLYGIRPSSKQGFLDNSVSTTDNSSPAGSQLDQNKIHAKVQHTPLKQKSKTSYFLRGQRRVSPVKQSIKMSQAELFPSSMSCFEKPREALLKTFDQLDSTIWEVNMSGLKSMVRMIRYHSEFLDSHMHMTCIQLTRSVRNLRSQVARAACQAAVELFTLKYKSLEVECDDLVCALLHRTADTNRFLRADATRALESMVDHVQPPKVLNILTTKGAQHQNSLVRTTTAKLLFRLVERLGSDRVYSMARENRDKFFLVGANLLLEGSLETRSYAKSLFRALSEHASYQRLLLEIIPPRTYRNVEKTLRGILR
ncbi:hypothetical protein KR222_008524 [Zaprionus bogoriensis]|nr:hypothetical protein KR222_008524 [Zaprionus bogoriensis]